MPNDYYQFQIEFNGTRGPILADCPSAQWTHIRETVLEPRGGLARLWRRLITDTEILPLLTDPTGYITLRNGTVIGPWQIFAELDYG